MIATGSLSLLPPFLCGLFRHVGRDSSVGTATRCGLGIESRCRWDFLDSFGLLLGPTPTSCTNGTVPPPPRGSKAVGTWRWLLSSTEIKERVELYSYAPLWAFMTCSGVNFTLFRHFCSFLNKSNCFSTYCYFMQLGSQLPCKCLNCNYRSQTAKTNYSCESGMS